MEFPREESDSQVPSSVDTPPDAPARLQCDGQQVGYIEGALGEWVVKYPGPDEMIQEDYVERLELKRDGTYTWNPPPAWAPSSGVWGVIKTEDGFLKLCFRDTRGRSRWGYLVLMRIGTDGPIYLNWQRTYGHAVIWADRIWRADRPTSPRESTLLGQIGPLK